MIEKPQGNIQKRTNDTVIQLCSCDQPCNYSENQTYQWSWCTSNPVCRSRHDTHRNRGYRATQNSPHKQANVCLINICLSSVFLETNRRQETTRLTKANPWWSRFYQTWYPTRPSPVHIKPLKNDWSAWFVFRSRLVLSRFYTHRTQRCSTPLRVLLNVMISKLSIKFSRGVDLYVPALAALVTAKNKITNTQAAPAWPRRILAALGAIRPALTSAELTCAPRATAARPRVVAKPNGIGNQDKPPIRKPVTAVSGHEAMARCQ